MINKQINAPGQNREQLKRRCLISGLFGRDFRQREVGSVFNMNNVQCPDPKAEAIGFV